MWLQGFPVHRNMDTRFEPTRKQIILYVRWKVGPIVSRTIRFRPAPTLRTDMMTKGDVGMLFVQGSKVEEMKAN
jgi:hypothetical protein